MGLVVGLGVGVGLFFASVLAAWLCWSVGRHRAQARAINKPRRGTVVDYEDRHTGNFVAGANAPKPLPMGVLPAWGVLAAGGGARGAPLASSAAASEGGGAGAPLKPSPPPGPSPRRSGSSGGFLAVALGAVRSNNPLAAEAPAVVVSNPAA